MVRRWRVERLRVAAVYVSRTIFTLFKEASFDTTKERISKTHFRGRFRRRNNHVAACFQSRRALEHHHHLGGYYCLFIADAHHRRDLCSGAFQLFRSSSTLAQVRIFLLARVFSLFRVIKVRAWSSDEIFWSPPLSGTFDGVCEWAINNRFFMSFPIWRKSIDRSRSLRRALMDP